MPGIAHRDATHALNDRFLVEKGRETLVCCIQKGEEELALEGERRWFVLKTASRRQFRYGGMELVAELVA